MILRGGILAVAALALGALLVLAARDPHAWPGALCAAVVVAGMLLERNRYRRSHADGDLTPTDERFRDPASGRLVQVWTDRTGHRVYREQP